MVATNIIRVNNFIKTISDMKKILLFLTTVATSLLFSTCSNEGLFDESTLENNPEAKRTISLTASMPDDEPSTRVSLTQDGKSIMLTWSMIDKIELLFKQGNTEIKQVASITSISNYGKSAQFEVNIPSAITSGAFDLYGVFGGQGLLNSNPRRAVLPEYAGTATSLNTLNDFSSVELRKDVMLYFTSKNIGVTNPQVSATFKHLGSLFSITVSNTSSTDLDDIEEARLVGYGTSTNWAYNNDSGGEYFDIVSEEFLNTENADYYISFHTDTYTLESGSSVTFWAWYPPLPDVIWPELTLELYDSYDDMLYETINPKPARTEPTMAGKAYYLYAELDDSELKFTNAPSFVDSRDGNVYGFVTVGDQVWMAENLKYLPSVVGPTTGSETVPYYYVYGYNGTDIYEAMATTNYDTYGVLYNWPAAMAGEAGSSSVPSGVQGVCPEGWHLPSDTEWSILIDYLGGSAVAGGKLKEAGTEHWYTPNAGATNSTGFRALPGGFLYNGGFANRTVNGFWYSTTDFDVNRAYGPYMYYNNNEVMYNGLTKDYAFSIRCVRDDDNMGMGM